MSRWGKGARWTADDLARHQAFYAKGEALPVIEEGASAAKAGHARWKAKEAAADVAVLYPLVGLCRAAGLPEPVPEYTFHPTRRWRFDYAFVAQRVAVEIEGGVWTQGRHTRGKGFLEDMAKYNAAVMFGWRVLRFTPDDLHHAIPPLTTLLMGDAA